MSRSYPTHQTSEGSVSIPDTIVGLSVILITPYTLPTLHLVWFLRGLVVVVVTSVWG